MVWDGCLVLVHAACMAAGSRQNGSLLGRKIRDANTSLPKSAISKRRFGGILKFQHTRSYVRYPENSDLSTPLRIECRDLQRS